MCLRHVSRISETLSVTSSPPFPSYTALEHKVGKQKSSKENVCRWWMYELLGCQKSAWQPWWLQPAELLGCLGTLVVGTCKLDLNSARNWTAITKVPIYILTPLHFTHSWSALIFLWILLFGVNFGSGVECPLTPSARLQCGNSDARLALVCLLLR